MKRTIKDENSRLRLKIRATMEVKTKMKSPIPNEYIPRAYWCRDELASASEFALGYMKIKDHACIESLELKILSRS